MQVSSFHKLLLLTHDLLLLIPSIAVLLLDFPLPLAMGDPLILVPSLRLIVPFPLALPELLDIPLLSVPLDVQLHIDALFVDLCFEKGDLL